MPAVISRLRLACGQGARRLGAGARRCTPPSGASRAPEGRWPVFLRARGHVSGDAADRPTKLPDTEIPPVFGHPEHAHVEELVVERAEADAVVDGVWAVHGSPFHVCGVEACGDSSECAVVAAERDW